MSNEKLAEALRKYPRPFRVGYFVTTLQVFDANGSECHGMAKLVQEALNQAAEAAQPDRLAEALRTLEDAALNGARLYGDDIPRLRATTERLTAHDAQPQGQNSEWVMVPREPTQAMLDANGDCDFPEGKAWLEQDARDTWAVMLAAAPQPQAAEPVAFRYLMSFGDAYAWTRWLEIGDKHLHETNGREIEYAYRGPQPAQDAKDAARYRHMIETSPFMCFGASEYHKKSDLDEAIDNSIAAMAKESGR